MQNRKDILLYLALVALSGSLLMACGPTELANESGSRIYEDWPIREQRVRQNMREVQVAAEHYASDHGHNQYPVAMDDSFKTYFPGGSPNNPSVVGVANPFTGSNEFPLIGHRTSVEETRKSKPFKVGGIGQVEYSALGNGDGYIIVGTDHAGLCLMDPVNPGQVLVLTNQEVGY
jgi:hypothetical protein